ncbi:MAG: tRNA-intron lyase [Thermoplasmatales archaeon]|nr:tRNA-intron lyase [Thermoplasmatales archaeon]
MLRIRGNFVEEKNKMSLIEACYLLEKGKTEVAIDGKKVDFEEFLKHATCVFNDFEIKYLVYRDLRERGYIAEIGDDFLLYERGKKPPAEPSFIVKAISERARFKIEDIVDWLSKSNKKIIIGIVDEEGDLTYYSVKFFEMKGEKKKENYKGNIVVLNDRSVVFDEQLIKKIRKEGIGRDFGKYSQLSLMESAYMAKNGANLIKNGDPISLKDFIKNAKTIQPDISERLKIYEDLKNKGKLPKTGFKFGSHFRVYDGKIEEHAPYLVHVIKNNYTATWAEISRAVRLAQSVKKEMIFAVAGKEIKYIRIKRITP